VEPIDKLDNSSENCREYGKRNADSKYMNVLQDTLYLFCSCWFCL